MGYYNYRKIMSESKNAEKVILQIKDSPEIKHCWDFTEEAFLSRIQYKNLCAININYTDDTNFYFYTPWNHEDEYINLYETVEIQDDVVKITIKK